MEVRECGRRGDGTRANDGGENVVEYFRKQGRISSHDAVEIIWYHAANRKAQMEEALKSDAHMIEADILIASQGSHRGEPIMAHPPETDSDNTLHNWLSEVRQSDKGIKLDFKRFIRPNHHGETKALIKTADRSASK